jgi:hypothetical protein
MLTEGATAQGYVPYGQLSVVGTPEVLTVGGPNLLNPATNITGKYIAANGSISNGDDAQYTDLIPVKAGEAYVCSFVSGRNKGTNRWHGYNASGSWVKELANVNVAGQQGNKLIMTATIDSGISYVRLSYGINDTEAMVVGIISDSIADKFYEGEMSSNKGKLRSLTEIQSPYTSNASTRCPATMYSVIPGRFYSVKNNVPPAVNIYTGFYENAEDVTDASKAVGNASGSSFTAPAGANYAVTVYLKQTSGTTYTFDKPMVSEVSLPDYQPYVEPQTASVPTLLSVGDVKDEAELISGGVTHKIGIKVFDGTEDWTAYTSSTLVIQNATSAWGAVAGVGGYCTHLTVLKAGETTFAGSCRFATALNVYEYKTAFGVADVAGFKAKLAEQYAAGTPVIILYPLATATTEQTTAQLLSTYEGTTVVDSVANVSPLEAEVKYMAASAQDVLSKLLGMKVTKKDISTQDAEEMIDIITGEENK